MKPSSVLLVLSIAFVAVGASKPDISSDTLTKIQQNEEAREQYPKEEEQKVSGSLRFVRNHAGFEEATSWSELAYVFLKSNLQTGFASVFNLLFISIIAWMAPYGLLILVLAVGGYYITFSKPTMLESPYSEKDAVEPGSLKKREYTSKKFK